VFSEKKESTWVPLHTTFIEFRGVVVVVHLGTRYAEYGTTYPAAQPTKPVGKEYVFIRLGSMVARTKNLIFEERGLHFTKKHPTRSKIKAIQYNGFL
jgi:hypothetical protein